MSDAQWEALDFLAEVAEEVCMEDDARAGRHPAHQQPCHLSRAARRMKTRLKAAVASSGFGCRCRTAAPCRRTSRLLWRTIDAGALRGGIVQAPQGARLDSRADQAAKVAIRSPRQLGGRIVRELAVLETSCRRPAMKTSGLLSGRMSRKIITWRRCYRARHRAPDVPGEQPRIATRLTGERMVRRARHPIDGILQGARHGVVTPALRTELRRLRRSAPRRLDRRRKPS